MSRSIHPTPSPDQGATCQPCRLGRAILAAVAVGATLALFAGCSSDFSSPDTDSNPATEPASAALAAVTRAPRSFFIHPQQGNDANAGTQAQPFKTLAHGLSLAIAGDTMRLAAGGYSALSGERFTNAGERVSVPAGVTILGTPAEDFTSQLHGAPGDSVGLDLKGGATIRNLVIIGFKSGIRAVKGVQTVQGVFFDQNLTGLEARGTAQTTLLGSTVVLSGSSDGVYASQQARVTLDASTITGGSPTCNINQNGILAADVARIVTRNGTALTNLAGLAVRLQQGTTGTLGSTTISRDLTGLPSCIPFPAIVALDSSSLSITGSKVTTTGGTSNGAFNSVGLRSNTQGQITIKGVTFSGHKDAGIRAADIVRITVANSTFDSNRFGISVDPNALDLMTITGSKLTKDSVGISGAGFKLRGSKVTGNKIGVELTAAQTDLGTLASPGNNVFTGNSYTSVNAASAQIPGTTQAAGNTWKAGTQGADGTGHYPTHPLRSGSPSPDVLGVNFMLRSDPNFKIQL